MCRLKKGCNQKWVMRGTGRTVKCISVWFMNQFDFALRLARILTFGTPANGSTQNCDKDLCIFQNDMSSFSWNGRNKDWWNTNTFRKVRYERMQMGGGWGAKRICAHWKFREPTTCIRLSQTVNKPPLRKSLRDKESPWKSIKTHTVCSRIIIHCDAKT